MKDKYAVDVSVVIVNYNSTKYVEDCLKSIAEHCVKYTYEVIVVDNASPDGGMETLKDICKDSRIIFVASDTNRGFGGACNLGVEHANGRYVFYLNPDTILLNDAIAEFVDFAKAMPDDKFALGGFLLDGNRLPTNSYSCFLTPGNILKRALGMAVACGNEEGGKPVDVDFITGADLFVPRSIVDRVKGFDEDFFMYCEDVDLQKRMADVGVRRMVIPGPKIIHFDGGSYEKKNLRSARRRKEYDRSKLVYIKKHYTPLEYCAFRLAFFLARIPAYVNPHYKMADNMKYAAMLLGRI